MSTATAQKRAIAKYRKTGGGKAAEKRYSTSLKGRFARAKAKARNRGQGWNLSYAQWLELWEGKLGMMREQTAKLRRIDLDEPWEMGNCEVATMRAKNDE